MKTLQQVKDFKQMVGEGFRKDLKVTCITRHSIHVKWRWFMGTNKMIVLHLDNGDKIAVRLSDIIEIHKVKYKNTLGVQNEVVNIRTVRGSMIVTDDFYYILNAVNGEESKK